MDASIMRETLVFISERCPSDIDLEDSVEIKNIFERKCTKSCLDCWVNALKLQEDIFRSE